VITKILAAIWYSEDQNEPSCPFVLRLEVPDDTKEAVAQALLAYAVECYSPSSMSIFYFSTLAMQNGENFANGFAINESPFCGDWCISNGSIHLFASQDRDEIT